MRIAYVSVDPGVSVFGPHGASVHIQEIVREFAVQGHEVTIFTTRRGDLQWQLQVVGDGPQRVPLMDLAQKLRVDADSSAHHYFSPLQVYEYLAAGLLIVASNIGQIPHAVGDAGVLVPGFHTSTLAQAINNLVYCPLRRWGLGVSGQRRHRGHRGHRGYKTGYGVMN